MNNLKSQKKSMISQKKLKLWEPPIIFGVQVQFVLKEWQRTHFLLAPGSYACFAYIVCIHWPSGSTTCACTGLSVCVPGSLALPLTSLLVCMHQPSPHLGFPDYCLIWGSHIRMWIWEVETMLTCLLACPWWGHQLPWWQNNKLRCQNPNGTWHRDMMTSSMEESASLMTTLKSKMVLITGSVYAWLKLYIRQPKIKGREKRFPLPCCMTLMSWSTGSGLPIGSSHWRMLVPLKTPCRRRASTH